MMTSEAASPELRRAAWSPDAGGLSDMEPWAEDRPDPTRWLATMGLEGARRRVEEALRAGTDPIVVSGPTGHGKTLLLRSLRTRPPAGFTPLFVPFSNVEPDELAGWILEAAHVRRDRTPVARLLLLLRTNARSAGGTLLLMDEMQATPCETVSKLFEIIDESRVAVSLVLAGLSGFALDRVLTAVPHAIREIEVCEPWSRADAELFVTRVAGELRVDPSDLIAAVDVDAALGDSAGNPRLVRAALAARLRVVGRARECERRVAAFTCVQPAARLTAPAPPGCPLGDPGIPIPSAQAPTAAQAPRPPSPIPRERPARILAARSRAWLERAACVTHEASRRAGRSMGTHGHRLGVAVRARTRALSGQLRARSLAHGQAIWKAARDCADRAYAIPLSIAMLAARVDWNEDWERATSSIRARARRMGSAARPRALALSAGLRSRSHTCGDAVWKVTREYARQAQATVASARLTLDQDVVQEFTRAANTFQRSARLAVATTLPRLAIVGAIAVLAALVAGGRARAPALAEVSQMGSDVVLGTAVEPIPFRMNSHPWSTVAIDGVEAGTTPFTIPLEPGPHHFRVAMADGRILEQTFVVSTLQDRLAFR